MYMSGVRTGRTVIVVLLKPILLVHRVVLTALVAAAVGTIVLSTAARPIATAFRQVAVTTFSACASSSPSNMLGTPLSSVPDASQMEELNRFLRSHKIVEVRKELPNNISSIALQKRALDDFLKKNE